MVRRLPSVRLMAVASCVTVAVILVVFVVFAPRDSRPEARARFSQVSRDYVSLNGSVTVVSDVVTGKCHAFYGDSYGVAPIGEVPCR